MIDQNISATVLRHISTNPILLEVYPSAFERLTFKGDIYGNFSNIKETHSQSEVFVMWLLPNKKLLDVNKKLVATERILTSKVHQRIAVINIKMHFFK